MKYNIAENSLISSNTTVGNVDLNLVQINNILNQNGTVVIEGSQSHKLCIDCDLGARVKVDKLKYYFESETASGTVSSGIAFYYKDESFENYYILNTYMEDSYYYSTVSGISSPRYVRVLHDLSGTSTSGTVTGLVLYNDDGVIDFGTDGSLQSEGLTLSLGSEEIREISVYNNGSLTSDAYIILEPQGTTIDDVLTISTSSSGPWVGNKDDDKRIVGVSSWDTGSYSNTTVSGNNLVIESGSSGTYTTKIFTEDYSKFTHVNIDVTIPTGAIVATNADDTISTMEIRYSDVKPKNLSFYRLLYEDTNNLKYKDYWTETGAVKYTSTQTISTATDGNWEDSYVTIDNETANCAGLAYHECTDAGENTSKVILFTVSGTQVANTLELNSCDANGETIDIDFRKVLLDSDGGVWVYFYSDKTADSKWVDATGYYLAHFDNNLTETFKLYRSSDFLYDCDVVYSDKSLWYTDLYNKEVKRVGYTGTVLSVVYENTENLRGICSNGTGCWYINADDLYQIDGDGELVKTLSSIGSANLLTRVALDGSNALWIRDGDYIKRIYTDNGRTDVSIVVSNNKDMIFSGESGVWVPTYDDEVKYISKYTRAVLQTVSYEYVPGFVDVEYTNTTYASEFPVSMDTTWTSLFWEEVRTVDYSLPDHAYFQIRITLRANDSLESPEISGLYIQNSLELENIYPSQYKSIYLRVYIPASYTDLSGDYGSNLKVHWEIPI